MKKIWGTIFACLAISGCATFTSPIPENYTGPVATVQDWVRAYSSGKADFFYVAEVNGNRIEDSLSKTYMVNRGRGMIMAPVTLERKVPDQLT